MFSNEDNYNKKPINVKSRLSLYELKIKNLRFFHVDNPEIKGFDKTGIFCQNYDLSMQKEDIFLSLKECEKRIVDLGRFL